MRIAALLLTLLFLTSCGFKPRGDYSLAQPLQNLYLQTKDPYGQLSRDLKQALTSSHVRLTDSAAKATTVLEIIREDTEEQLLSVGGTQQIRQYNLVLTVVFQVTDAKGIVLMPPLTLREIRTIPISSNLILGGSNEANNLYAQMRVEMANDIMNRLASRESH